MMKQVIKLIISGLILAHLGAISANEMQGASNDRTFIRDPFTPSILMYEQAGTVANIDSDAFGFRPAPDDVEIQIPKMRLRGFITPEGEQEELALLEISGSGVYMVREGDEINIDPRQPANAIRISEISRLSITIETGTLGRIRVLR
ncbi:hypothetical protein [Methylophaga sp. OBS1]|uniref:hypothetical protein n=1 Tax=Methylophaga sp. OBS1 TaxID=2991933 RepID=UPI002250464F|nr:hypothetical protein [Methylophaga sp. OBS1]MCX4190963.1 hypothetical protein [Methylophaga sp. OBS1]MCX4192091.1 hypothetical protein [Methylophaga sp. OBS1]